MSGYGYGYSPPVAPQTVPPVVRPIAPQGQQWKVKFPSVIAGILAALEFIVAIVIIGCELGSVLIDIVTATIYVGFWSGIFFMIAWISLAGSSCCCRSCGCATYTLVIQCISLFFAACVIGFDAYYLVYPTTCFFPTTVCGSSAPIRGVFYTDANFVNIKMPLIKGQLAAGSVMFVLCLIYIIIYIVTTVRVNKAQRKPSVYPQQQSSVYPQQQPNVFPQQQPYALPPVPTGPDGMITAPPMVNVRQQRVTSPLYHRPTMIVDNGDGRTNDLACPTCSTTMAVSVRKKMPQ